jgi:ribonuclease T2
MKFGRIAAVLFAAFACFASPALAQGQGKPGRFDFYVLTLSWSPSYCEAEQEKGRQRRSHEQCNTGRPYAFVVHGLWPQYERGYPQNCMNPAPFIPESTIQSMLPLMPARGLIIHEWRTHGTCSGLNAEEYFDAVRAARQRVVIPEKFGRIDDYTMVSPAEVEDAFVAANRTLKPDMIAVTCDSRRLHEVRICMSRDFEFRACPDVDRRACRTPRVVMPPVRGG